MLYCCYLAWVKRVRIHMSSGGVSVSGTLNKRHPARVHKYNNIIQVRYFILYSLFRLIELIQVLYSEEESAKWAKIIIYYKVVKRRWRSVRCIGCRRRRRLSINGLYRNNNIISSSGCNGGGGRNTNAFDRGRRKRYTMYILLLLF